MRKNLHVDYTVKSVIIESKGVRRLLKCVLYLYGSYARGDFHEESDIDILLTVEQPQSVISHHRSDIAELSSDLSLEHDITVSISVKPAEQFERLMNVLPFYQNVVREGIKYAS